MNYLDPREYLRRRGLGNWDTLSDAAVARIVPGIPAAPPRKEVEASDPYGPEERLLINCMTARQESVYTAIRRAAAAGDWAPRWSEMENLPSVGTSSALGSALAALVRIGAIVRINRAGRVRAVYVLPVVGIETRRQ